MLTPYLKKLIKGEDLTAPESAAALETILTVENPVQIAAFLVLMRAKGETATEMASFVQVMQKHQRTVETHVPVLDIVGTGGDGAHTANISTGASILAASCGIPVLKHGNRAVSSQSGAADVLQALGLTLEQTPEQVAQSVEKNNLGFCFAPCFHPYFAALKPLRTQLKVPTFFNILGPLLNPGKAKYMVLGVFSHDLQKLMADILVQIGIERAMVVHAHGLDELSCLGPCDVIEIHHGVQKKYVVDPEALGLPLCQLSDLVGADAHHNALLIEKIVQNEPSPLANTVILNAAAAVYIYGKTENMKDAIALIQKNVANGNAQKILQDFLRSSHE
jgi:anthranilate phosphoribosyltransferase